MTKELKKRIITSILLFLLSIFCIFVNKYFFITAILILSYFAFDEICIIITRVRNLNEPAKFLFRFIGLFYLFGIFALSSLGLYFADGPFFFLYILSICICSDIGGYIIGKNIGGKKLTKISPNKTIIGAVGSFILSLLPLIIFYLISETQNLFGYNILENIILCLFISLICQIGDLFISYFKRLAKVKDTGKILPGHGGILDRIDGIIFAIPSVNLFIGLFF